MASAMCNGSHASHVSQATTQRFARQQPLSGLSRSRVCTRPLSLRNVENSLTLYSHIMSHIILYSRHQRLDLCLNSHSLHFLHRTSFFACTKRSIHFQFRLLQESEKHIKKTKIDGYQSVSTPFGEGCVETVTVYLSKGL